MSEMIWFIFGINKTIADIILEPIFVNCLFVCLFFFFFFFFLFLVQELFLEGL